MAGYGQITFTHKGSFKNTEKFLKKIKNGEIYSKLDQYGRRGVDALSSATPVRTGKTASSWGYEIHHSKNMWKITWTNSNVNDGVNIAIILEYGHGTKNGGYVQGRDYINPAIQPIFDEIADNVWKEVTSA